jgi:hypothetical protein
VFIAFLSLYAYSKLEAILKKADLNRKVTPADLLFELNPHEQAAHARRMKNLIN